MGEREVGRFDQEWSDRAVRVDELTVGGFIYKSSAATTFPDRREYHFSIRSCDLPTGGALRIFPARFVFF